MLVALGTAGVVGTSWVYTASEFFADYGAGGEIFGLGAASLLAACVALAYAELSARFPRAGGELVFAYVAFGPHIAFVAGWLLIGAYISSLAFYVSASGMLLAIVFPALKDFPIYSVAGTEVYLPMLSVGIALALTILGLTTLGMRLAGSLQLVLFAAMLLVGLALASVGFSEGSLENFWPAFKPDQHPVASVIRFVLPAMTFLTGFSLVAALAEDADLPPRRIGQAVVVTVLTAAAFYGTVLLATAWLIPWQTTAALQEGVIDAFRHAGYPTLSWGAYFIAALGLLTSFLAFFSAASRVILAMARAGLFPQSLAQLSSGGRPVNALLFTFLLTLGLGWLGKGALLWFLDTAGVYIGLAWLITVVSLYRIRRLYPGGHLAFRVHPGWLPAVGAVAALLVIVATLIPGTSLSLTWPQEYLILFVWLVLGACLYRFALRGAAAGDLSDVLGDNDLPDR